MKFSLISKWFNTRYAMILEKIKHVQINIFQIMTQMIMIFILSISVEFNAVEMFSFILLLMIIYVKVYKF